MRSYNTVKTRYGLTLACKACELDLGGPPEWVSCHQCALVFHVHQADILAKPVNSLMTAICPDPACKAENVFLRVISPPYLANADAYADQKTGWWGHAN